MTNEIENQLQDLIHRAYAHEAEVRRACPSALTDDPHPVLWFGDVANWLNQPPERRILTAGVNPGPGTFLRPANGEVWWAGVGPELQSYTQAMANYMGTLHTRSADRAWFGSYSPVLRAFRSAYQPHPVDLPARAIHTDICSPLVTKSAWSAKDGPYRHELAEVGVPLWLDLLQILKPTVVVLSINKQQWGIVSNALGVGPENMHFYTDTTKAGEPFRAWKLSTHPAQLALPGGGIHRFQVLRGSKLGQNPFTTLDGDRLYGAAQIAARALGWAGAEVP